MRRGWKVMLAAVASLALACGGEEADTTNPGSDEPGEGDGDGGQGNTPQPTSNRAAYVFDTVTVPTDDEQAQEVALDLDGDGSRDNALGEVVSTLLSFSDSTDVQGQVDEALADGSLILLADLGYETFNAGAGVMGLYEGAEPSTSPCSGPGSCGKHLQGGTSFSVSAVSPTDNSIAGELENGWFSGNDGVMSIPVPLGEQITNLTVIGAATQAIVSKTDMAEGIMAGGVTEEEINTVLIPAIAVMLNDLTSQACDQSCSCQGEAQTIMNLFDSNDDCSISSMEIQDNFLVQTLLKPDLDLLDENGDYNPGVDGVLDSMSVGVGYTAINADFEVP